MERSESLKQPGPTNLSKKCPVFFLRPRHRLFLCLPLSDNSYPVLKQCFQQLPCSNNGGFGRSELINFSDDRKMWSFHRDPCMVLDVPYRSGMFTVFLGSNTHIGLGFQTELLMIPGYLVHLSNNLFPPSEYPNEG